MYKEVFHPNTAHADAKFKVEIETVLADRLLHYILHKLKRRKAAGIDEVVNEHLLLVALICRVVHLCLLFNCMLKHAYVPAEFCQGVIIPLLKAKHGDATRIDMYRGITLTCIVEVV